MVETLEHVELKSGERMAVVKTTAPEPDWCDRVLTFLVHKGDLWLDPMREGYQRGLDALVMSDFMGVLEDGQVVGNITTAEHLGVGILQHVFTSPQHRRKGICEALMAALCRDFVARGGRASYLGTGYDSAPYHIYERFGFRGCGDSGKMIWFADPDFERSWFAPAPAAVRDTRWDDWPLLGALYAVRDQWRLKGMYFGQFGHANYESEYLSLRRAMAEGKVLQVKVLATDAGAIVGHAFVAPQAAWRGRVWVLDFMLHQGFYGQAGALLSALELPAAAKVQAFCDERARDKMAALEALGFEREGVFARQMEDQDHVPLDVVVYGRLG